MLKAYLFPIRAVSYSRLLKLSQNWPSGKRLFLSHSWFGYQTLFTSVSVSSKKKYDDLEPTTKELAPRKDMFNQLARKDKKTFLSAIERYTEHEAVKRGHIEFIYAALKSMSEFGVEGDLEVYKKLMNVFPKGKFIPKNLIQAEFYHFPRHQDCGIYLLEQMEYNGVLPDEEMKELILNIFGRSTHVFKKYGRIIYWGTKLKNVSPFVLPDPLPSDAEQLARLAVKRMSVDLRAQIEHFKAEELEDSVDKTWIVSSQSPDQQKLIEDHPVDQPLYVDGSFLIWLKKISISYFILRAPPKKFPEVEVDTDDVSDLPLHMFGLPKPPELLVPRPSIHEQEDGTIVSLCATGTSSKDSLLSWIRFLQRTNPKLSEIPILFTLRSPPTALTVVNFDPEQRFSSEQYSNVAKETSEQEIDQRKSQSVQT